jgi:very-short-patch-repair endonuclease
MARPLITNEGKLLPVGDAKFGRTSYPGLAFTRVRGVRRLRTFPAAPRRGLTIEEQAESFEERYQEWFRIHRGTRPEFIVFDYLEKVAGLKHLADFIFQSSQLGGRQRIGGAVVDFELPFRRLYFRVQGERFHLSPDRIAHDAIQRAMLSGFGWTVVDIWVDQLLAAPSRVIEAALNGVNLREPRQG